MDRKSAKSALSRFGGDIWINTPGNPTLFPSKLWKWITIHKNLAVDIILIFPKDLQYIHMTYNIDIHYIYLYTYVYSYMISIVATYESPNNYIFFVTQSLPTHWGRAVLPMELRDLYPQVQVPLPTASRWSVWLPSIFVSRDFLKGLNHFMVKKKSRIYSIWIIWWWNSLRN